MKSVSIASMILLTLGACTTDKSQSAADSANVNALNASEATQQIVVPTVETPAPAPTTTAEPKAGQWQVTAAGIGDIRAGMSVEEANVAIGNSLAIPAKLQECDYVRPKTTPKNLAFMVEKNEIARVEVRSGSDISTVEGAKIGDSEARIKTLYPGVEVRPAKYGSGHALVVTPKGGGNNRIVFETDGGKVTRYRSGKLPAVEYVEGCG
ncbi:MAG: hypothetical protein ABJC63_09925 [Gemmatimonadales bacterium]